MSTINLAREIVSRKQDPNKNAYLYGGAGLSYGRLFQRAASLAQELKALGLVSRQRIVIFLYDTPAVAEVFLAALAMGAIPVVVNPRLGRDSLSHILSDSEAALLVCEYDNLALASAVAATTHAPRLLLQDCYKTAAATAPEAGADTTVPRLSALTQHEHAFQFTLIGPDEAAFWQYTSGTTGRPKAVQHCSATMLENSEAFAVRTHGLTSEDVFYSAAKMFFGYGFGASFFFPLLLGASAVLDPAMPSNDVAALRNIATYRPTAIFCAPALYASLLNHAERLKPYLGHRALCVSAGSSLPKSIFERWRTALGIAICDGIGSTEMGHIFVANTRVAVKAGTTGRAVDGYALKLIAPDSAEPGMDPDAGILCVKGAHPHLGYWNRPEASAAKFVDGWYVTGDLFTRDAQHFYTYRGRCDDLFKANGIWVTPLAIESEILMRLPQVLECALVPHQGDTELAEPLLFCVIDPKLSTRDDGVAAIHALLGAVCEKHSQPKRVVALEVLPRNDNGKVSRAALSALSLEPTRQAQEAVA
ncbi:MAG: AMP-binding protein [Pseudomonadota bacterium]